MPTNRRPKPTASPAIIKAKQPAATPLDDRPPMSPEDAALCARVSRALNAVLEDDPDFAHLYEVPTTPRRRRVERREQETDV